VRRYGFHGLSYEFLLEELARLGDPAATKGRGHLDPGLVSYLSRTEQMSATQFQEMVNHASGLLGVSEISSDLRDLLARESDDVRAAERWIGLRAEQAQHFLLNTASLSILGYEHNLANEAAIVMWNAVPNDISTL
jgi:acetate kinase